jgi:hypothetical protein
LCRGVGGQCRLVPSAYLRSGNSRSHDGGCPRATQWVNSLCLGNARVTGALGLVDCTHHLHLIRAHTACHWCEQAGVLPVFNAGGSHARGPCQTAPCNFRDAPRAMWQYRTIAPPPGRRAVAGSTSRCGNSKPPWMGVRKASVEVCVTSVMARTRDAIEPLLAGCLDGQDGTRGGLGPSHGGPVPGYHYCDLTHNVLQNTCAIINH